MRSLRACFGIAFGLLVFAGTLIWGDRLEAGSEKFTITCGNQSGPSPIVVPVTITMDSDGPDYIDTVYTAQDGGGNALSCAPSGNRLYVAKGSHVIDYVTVTGDGSGSGSFSATGQGEVTGYDNSGCGCYLTFTGYGNSTPATLGPPLVGQGTGPISFLKDTRIWVCVVPLEMELNASPDWIKMQYSAVDAKGRKLTCIPASELVMLYASKNKTPPPPLVPQLAMRHLAIRSSHGPIPQLTLSVNATGLATGNPKTENTGSWNFPIAQATQDQPPVFQNIGAAANTGNLLVGFNPSVPAGVQTSMPQFNEHIIGLSVAVAKDDKITMKFIAEDSNGQTLTCNPRTWTVHHTVGANKHSHPNVVIKCKGTSPQVTLRVYGRSELTGDFKQSYTFTK